ncbi:MAG: putative dynein heavy chain, partial [Streblomastix strix]
MQQLPRGLAEYCEFVVLLGTMGDAHEKIQSEVNALDELKEISEQQGVKLAIEEIDADAVASGVASVAREAGILTNKDAEDRVARRLKLEFDDFKPAVRIISALCVKAMQPRHWKKLFNLMGGKPWKPGCNLTELLQMNILQFKQQVLEISATANGEYALESQFEKIKAAWKDTSFETKEHKSGTWILGPIDEITEQMEDHMALLQTMLASRYVVGIREEIELWDKRLTGLQDLMDEWVKCQRGWMYLSAIFTQPDIVRQLPQDAWNNGENVIEQQDVRRSSKKIGRLLG